MTSPPKGAERQQREAFEAALRGWRDWPLDRMPIEGLYRDERAQLAWCGWQLAHLAPLPPYAEKCERETGCCVMVHDKERPPCTAENCHYASAAAHLAPQAEPAPWEHPDPAVRDAQYEPQYDIGSRCDKCGRVYYTHVCRPTPQAAEQPPKDEKPFRGSLGEAAIRAAFDGGWLMAARWSGREDLVSDMDSPAYLAERDSVLNGDCGATRLAREAEHGPGVIPQTGLREQCEAKADPGGSHGGEAPFGVVLAAQPEVVKAAAGGNVHAGAGTLDSATSSQMVIVADGASLP